MDDEFALNIGCIVLILVSFFWMLQHDFRDQKLSRDPRKRRQLVIVLVSSEVRLKPEAENRLHLVRSSLQAHHFQVKTIRIVERAASGAATDHEGRATEIILEVRNAKLVQARIEQLVRDFKTQLGEQNLKLHACIDLQQFDCTDSNDIDECEQTSQASNLLLIAFRKFMLEHGTRLITVRDSRCQAKLWPTSSSSKFKLERFLHETFEQLTRCKRVKLDRAKLAGIPLAEIHLTGEKEINWKQRLSELTLAVITWGEESMYAKEARTETHRDSPDRSQSVDKKLSETITELVLLLRPHEAKIEL